jgi:hypothetical protein
MLKLFILVNMSLATFSINLAYAGGGNNFENGNINNAIEFKERSLEECTSINSEMGEWFDDKTKDLYEYKIVNGRFQSIITKAPSAPIEKKLGPIRDQGQIGWCFAFAAADMMSGETNTYISAALVAKNYFTKSKIAWIWGGKEGGFIGSAIDLSLNKPMCEEKTFPSKGQNVDSVKNVECQEPIITMENFKTKAFTANGNPGGNSLFPEIDRILANGEIAGIHYNANKTFLGAKDGITNAWANHASTIVARYFNKNDNKCRYIIRNTWGSTCMSSVTLGTECKAGYYSVTEENLHHSLTQVIELKQKN